MITQMSAVIFYVHDLDQACEFYTHALGLKLAYYSKKTGWAEFDLGGARLALQQRDPCGGGRNPLLSLRVVNLRSAIEVLKSRGVYFEDNGILHEEFFGTWVNCLDGDSNVINLFEPKAT